MPAMLEGTMAAATTTGLTNMLKGEDDKVGPKACLGILSTNYAHRAR